MRISPPSIAAGLLIGTLALPTSAEANPILLKIGKWAAAAAGEYAVDAALKALTNNNASSQTYYRVEQDASHFVLDFHSGFDGDLSQVVLSFDDKWYFRLAINAQDFWGLSYEPVDSISFDGTAYHKAGFVTPTDGHPDKGGTVSFAFASPSGADLIWDTSGLNEYFFPSASIAGKYTVNGTNISWDVPITDPSHGTHLDDYSAAKFVISTDARSDGTPADDILSWSLYIEARHVPEPATGLLALLGAGLGLGLRQRNKR